MVVVAVAIRIAVIVVHVAGAASSTATTAGHRGRRTVIPSTATVARAADTAIALRKRLVQMVMVMIAAQQDMWRVVQ